jgi:recombination protein RecT
MSASKQGMMLANQKSIAGLLKQMEGEIARCLPSHLTPDRMARIAMTELRKNPKLQECEPMSFIAAIMQASQLGLEPGVLGSCYLIPFNNKQKGIVECTFMPGYRGFLDLARRSGQIISLVARAVYYNDTFEYEFGLKESLIHKPSMDDPGDLVAVYAVATLKDGGHQFDVMSKRQVDLIREGSQSRNNGPWVTHYEEMAKKTVLRKLFKWLPCSVEMQKVVSLDEQQEQGRQDIKSAASEEFDMSFTIEGEVNKSDDLKALMEKNKSEAKKCDPETGQVLPDHLQ